jgi:hypothetical protein
MAFWKGLAIGIIGSVFAVVYGEGLNNKYRNKHVIIRYDFNKHRTIIDEWKVLESEDAGVKFGVLNYKGDVIDYVYSDNLIIFTSDQCDVHETYCHIGLE